MIAKKSQKYKSKHTSNPTLREHPARVLYPWYGRESFLRVFRLPCHTLGRAYVADEVQSRLSVGAFRSHLAALRKSKE